MFKKAKKIGKGNKINGRSRDIVAEEIDQLDALDDLYLNSIDAKITILKKFKIFF